MEANSTLVALSAFSGLAGAVLTQALTGLFTYLSDNRKARFELNRAYRHKQVEVAENFYYVTGETMAMLKKSIEHWRDKGKSRSEASITFFNKEIQKLDVHMEKLNADNWKKSLIGLYFNVSLSYNELIKANTDTHLLFLSLLDLSDVIREANGEERYELIGRYHLKVYDLCEQYDSIYNMLEKDMNIVKNEILRTFQVK